MEKKFDNQIAFITGGATGIGKATAIAFAKLGTNIALADVQDCSETIALVEKAGAKAIYFPCDVSSAQQVEKAIANTIETFGRIDYAVNNAGTEGIQLLLQDLTEEQWNSTININLKGVWLCMKYQIPQMLKQGKGAIVNIASIAGVVAFPNTSAYVSSKHGVVGLTKVAALENSKTGIRVNAVCPGVIKTPMIDRALGGNAEAEKMYASAAPMNRLGKPEEIADAIVFLCSDAASYITGHSLVADGGWVVQ